MADLISRDFIKSLGGECIAARDSKTHELLPISSIDALPSAQQEPKSPLYYGDGYSEGKMVYDSAECPNCGYIYDEGDQVWGEPYCPHCGQALDWYMRGEQDE